jgi:hypothetical protein
MAFFIIFFDHSNCRVTLILGTSDNAGINETVYHRHRIIQELFGLDHAVDV